MIYVAFFINALIVVLEAIRLTLSFMKHHFGIFVFYTQLSNFVLLVTSLIGCIFFMRKIISKKEVPSWLGVCKFTGAALVAETFVIVIAVLFPLALPKGMDEAMSLFKGNNLYFHVVCPVLAMVSFLAFEKGYRLRWKDALLALIPTVIYAIVTTTLNIAKVIEGPYPFLRVYRQPVWLSVMWFFAIPGVSYALAMLLLFIYKKIYDKIS